MSKDSKIIDKIRKILRLSRSDNPHEAARALMMAQAISNRYGIDINSIKEEKSEPILGKLFSADEANTVRSDIGRELAAQFRVALIRLKNDDGYEILVMGYPEDVKIYREVEAYTLEYFRLELTSYEKMVTQFYGDVISAEEKKDYLTGFLIGLKEKFAVNVEENALTIGLPPEVKDFLDHLTSGEKVDREREKIEHAVAARMGYASAKKITPHKNITE